MLNLDVFEDHVVELENYYGKQLSDFVRATWLQTLSKLSNEQFIKAVARTIATEKFFPTAKQILELALGEAGPPGENWIKTEGRPDYLALPSAEINANGLTYEQRMANLEKVSEMSERYRRRRRGGNWTKVFQVINPETEELNSVPEDYKAIANALLAQWEREAAPEVEQEVEF